MGDHDGDAMLQARGEQVVTEPGMFEAMVAASAGQPRYSLPGADRATLVATVNG